ncbi:glutamate receptor 2.3-like protein [Cinnamomum micranthum f. kanehirae]|uniref:Glutamate receptor n=1 Tax=Cinnamomum micranthum f. kanehirae TaxID=337451 RepID=A0A443NA33_9MAGN|nr:glutamate receptor 2.3-like protein [Cinnamomum micranthum f. kanehirae]
MGKMSARCISMALADFYTTHNKYSTKLNLHWRDSNQDNVDAASMATDLIKNVQVKAIIGPQTSSQAQFVMELVVQIFEDTLYGNGVISHLTDALQEVDARVAYRSVISDLMTDDEIAQELYKMKTMQTRVFIVHLSPSLSSRLFFKVNEVGMMSEGYAWIITDRVANQLDSMNTSVIESMQGVLGVRPYVPKSKNLDNFKKRWNRKVVEENPNFEVMELNIFGLWAYDTVWALAKAVEEETRYNSTYSPRLGVFEMAPRLRDAILKTNFKGLSGRFNLTKGQLESPTFQIVNVNENGERGIGFWTPSQGLPKKLNTTSKKTYSTSKGDLKPIIWPGESMRVPKGWAVPTCEKKLKIGVPKRYGFTEFVNVRHDSQTSQWVVTGYCIDLFEAAIKQLPYAIDYELVPFVDKDGNQAGPYNALIDAVYYNNFDAVVGDVTIIANRSSYVDFTLPYTESGVTLVVLVKENRNKAWIFLKPLRWDVWLTTGLAFIFTGFVVWTLEHRINDEFRGPAPDQVGVTLWFSFSTLVFAHRAKLESNWSRFVVIIWVFVVWILSNSYIASFSSLLTVQRLQPVINDINDLIKNGANVGYQNGSFVLDLLRTLNVEEPHLKPYTTAEEIAEAMTNGTVSAIFGEIPYLRLFLAKNENCAKYKMVGPTYKTDGFGFVFPIGSPLVPDMSRAILNVTQGPTMKLIEKKWILQETACLDQPLSTASSSSLTLDSFWGLFLITGVASLFALLISLSIFLYKNGHLLRDSSVPFGQRLREIGKCFLEKDPSHHTARTNDGQPIGNGDPANSPPNADVLPIGSGHAKNSPHSANGETTAQIAEVNTHEQQSQPLNPEPVGQEGGCPTEPGYSDPDTPLSMNTITTLASVVSTACLG